MSTSNAQDLVVAIFSGGSGAGKSTLIRNILDAREDSYLAMSSTTRAKRSDDSIEETNFLTSEKFKEMEDSGSFLWSTSVHGKRYGTEVDFFKRQCGLVLCDVAYPSAAAARREISNFRPDLKIFSCYLFSPPPEQLRKRLLKRGDLESSISRRMLDCELWDDNARRDNQLDILLDGSHTPEEKLSTLLSVLPS
ncbi:hypothetical protein N9850_07795 [Granulosicoccus sp.]|nr:hypothetical protein [Granulosicoccus sp.]MDB4223663.1 hypothetical protein [Granulosicoccus sp.]